MSEQVTLSVAAEGSGARIDKYISDNIALTRSAVQGLLSEGGVLVNGKAVSKNYKLREGDSIDVERPDPEPMDAAPEDIPLDIVYEDSDLLVVNKPKGMVVHPAHGNYTGTLVNALLHHCGDSLSGINGVLRPGIVHRIDMDTTGSLIVCKNDKAHQSIAAQIKEHSTLREYTAIVYGRIEEDTLTIDSPIGRDVKNRLKMACRRDGKSRKGIRHTRRKGI